MSQHPQHPDDAPETDATGTAEAGEAVHEPPPESDSDGDGPGTAPAEMPMLPALLESLLFAADRPLTIERLRELLVVPAAGEIREALDHLEKGYLDGRRGIQLHQVAGGYLLRTAPDSAPWVQKLLQARPVRLTRAQLETLAIVAYRQPITRPEIDEIRGVDSGGTLKVLLERHLLRILGKKEEPGRPILYGTTKDFLEFFNLRDLKDLPTLREYYELSEEHQAQVNSMSAALEDIAPKDTVEPAPPPPLGRVELKDLDLGDDEEELSRIDEMISAVHVDAPVPAGKAGVANRDADKEADKDADKDERPPEEL